MEPLELTQKDEEKPEAEWGEEEEDAKTEEKTIPKIGVVSLCLDNTGSTIYAGCTDNIIRIYEIKEIAA